MRLDSIIVEQIMGCRKAIARQKLLDRVLKIYPGIFALDRCNPGDYPSISIARMVMSSPND